jgi:hypothetical protein
MGRRDLQGGRSKGMIYSYPIVAAPYNNGKIYEVPIKLTHGVIHKVELVFPSGCAGLVYCAINDGLHQVWPSNPDDMFFADDETISFREHYPLTEEPYTLQAKVVSLDDTYQHTLILRIGILPVAILSPWLTQYDERLRTILGAE